MQENTIRHETAKHSLLYRQLFLKNLTKQYWRLRRLQARALGHATEDVVFFAAAILPLPATTPREIHELVDNAKREDFPWLNECGSSSDSDGSDLEIWSTPSEEEQHESRKRKRSNDINVPSDPWQHCLVRSNMEMAMNRHLIRLTQRPELAHLSDWEDSFPGMLEDFLNHLDGHCCPPVAAAFPQRSVQGQNGDPNTSERHRDCVSKITFNRLEEEIDDIHERIEDTVFLVVELEKKNACKWSRRTSRTTQGSRARIMKSSGLGSPLIESSTPDDRNDDFVYDSWESWDSAVRSPRHVLVENPMSGEREEKKYSGWVHW